MQHRLPRSPCDLDLSSYLEVDLSRSTNTYFSIRLDETNTMVLYYCYTFLNEKVNRVTKCRAQNIIFDFGDLWKLNRWSYANADNIATEN